MSIGRLIAGGTLLTLFLTTVPRALADDDVMTPETVAKLQGVRQAAISPDGSQIAYLLSVPRIPGEDKNGSSYSELHVVDRDANSRPFITGEVSLSSIGWTPDGQSITFLTKRDGDDHTSLYAIPVTGGEAQKILEHETSIRSYSLNPDGTQVAFLAADAPDKTRKARKKKGFDAEVFEEELVFTRAWIGTPDGDDKPRMLPLEGNASDLHWSPAGDTLSVALAPTPLVDDGYMSRKLHVVSAENGEVLAQFENPGKLGQSSFNPDGTRLAVISAEEIHDPSAGRLMVADVKEGTLTDILPNFEGHITSVGWKGNDTILFLADQGTTTSVETIGFDGENRKILFPTGRAALMGLTLTESGDGGAVLSDSPNHPPEVYAMTIGDRFARRLTNSNPWLGDIQLAKQETIRFKARDGLEVEGILIHPLDEVEGQRYPLIMAVHGGPEAHIKNGWLTRYSYPGQVAAAKGYAVFYPNYRGSTGRGVAYSKMGQGDYGGAEFDDLIDSIDHLVDIGLVDGEKVGITGGSYGGFATAWCSTKHTDRFAAGVMFVGISDQISKSGSTDIANEMFLVHARKRPWDDWQFFLERSPIYYVEQARTPLLIMHGKEDPRVHPSQSLELYRQLKVLGQTPVRLVWYPGEGHGNRKAGGRYDYNLRMMRWFDHYLKGEGGNPPPAEVEYILGAEKEDDGEASG